MNLQALHWWQEAEALKAQLASYDPQKEIRQGDNLQAARAKFRTLKGALRSHMVMVDTMLGSLDELGRANVVTKVDIAKVRELRDFMREARAQGLEMKAQADA